MASLNQVGNVMKANTWPAGVPMATPILESRIFKMISDHSHMEPSPEVNLICAVIGQAIIDQASIKNGRLSKLLEEAGVWAEAIGIEPDFIKQIYEIIKDQPRLCSALSVKKCDCPACSKRGGKNPITLCYKATPVRRYA